MHFRRLLSAFILRGAVLVIPFSTASAANLTLVRISRLVCPLEDSQLGVPLVNLGAGAETIPAGAILSLTFSVPVTGIFNLPVGMTATYAGNTATVTLNTAVTVLPNAALWFSSIRLKLAGMAGGVPISVEFTSNPSSALTFTGGISTTVIALTDAQACQFPVANSFTAEELTGSCPTAADVQEFNTALNITFESDPTKGTLVCRASQGSVDLTRLQERTYQALRMMQWMPLDTSLPWTPKSLYDWFVSAVRGIRFRGDITYSFCCDPAGIINIQTANLAVVQFTTPEWLAAQMVLLIHEARHNEGLPHTCGTNDLSLPELGSWGVQYYMFEWMALHSGNFFVAKAQAGSTPVRYREWLWGDALPMFAGAICDLGNGLVVAPPRVDFGSRPLNVSTAPVAVAATWTKNAQAAVFSASLGGANPDDFSITGNTCLGTVMPPSCTVQVRFQPRAAGTRNALLSISHSLPGSPQAVILTGTGRAAQSCTFNVSSSRHNFDTGGGRASFNVLSQTGCEWTAASSARWITVTSGRAGSGNGTVRFHVTDNTSLEPRQGTITAAGETITVFQSPVASARPRFFAATSTNAASFAPGFTAGSLGTIFGSALTRGLNGVEVARTIPWPTELAGTSVRFNGIAAHLSAVANVDGQEQINLQVPSELAGMDPVTVVVNNNGVESDPVAGKMLPALPGIFTMDGFTGAILSIPDYRLVNDANPTSAGQYVAVFATGLGKVDPAPPDGSAAPGAEPFSRTLSQPMVTIGGINTEVLFSGLAPGFAGLFQINLRIPPGVRAGRAPIVVTVNDMSSKPAYIAIR
ncbi:MAG: choice-of-anchor D domain-containing protein [Acidobacteriales bacterium]|nr:choice-of-anchor D domain-containing protein [Terriglobales bacterium]